jgi:hypothetical protein
MHLSHTASQAAKSLDSELRTCLGAFRTSPIPSLHVEAGELPLSFRRPQLSLQYIVKLRWNPSNPAFNCVINTDFGRLFEARSSVIATLPQAATKRLGLWNQFEKYCKVLLSRRFPLGTKSTAISVHALITGQQVRSLTNRVWSSTERVTVWFDYEGYTRIY